MNNKSGILASLLLLATGLAVVKAGGSDIDPKLVPLEELNRRCDAAREEKLAPLRDAEIARCKADKRNDPAYCDRYFKTYGDATYATGTYVPRMFNDLPECVVAEQERKRRLRLGE